MATLSTLFTLFCDMDYEPTPEEKEANRILREEQAEREKRAIYTAYQFQCNALIDDGGALGVKVLREKNGQINWMNTKLWPFHYLYCVSNLGETRTLQEFNEQVYTGKDRSMMFATVVAYPAPDNKKYCCLELNPADPMTDLEALNEFFKQVKGSFQYNEEPLYFRPTSTIQVDAIKDKTLSLPVLSNQAHFAGIKYKVTQCGEIQNKTVKIFTQKNSTEGELNKWLLQRTPDEVIVIPFVPSDIPVVAGVICGEIIPPFCHVALLCQNRKTPCCYSEGCVDLVTAAGLANLVAEGAIGRTGFYLNAEEKLAVQRAETVKVDVPKPNTRVRHLIELSDKQAIDITIIGAKAVQFAQVETMHNQPLLKGTFVIPFHHYQKHVYKNHDIYNVILATNDLMKKKDFNFNKFGAVQEKIREHQVDEELVMSVMDKIKQHNMTSVIFRSSTNAEDLTGFNGAGMYESVPLKGQDLLDVKLVGAAIGKVWASVWSPKAVKEREFYQIPQKSVNMAVLVQPFIDDKVTGVKVHYNGVCITHDVARHKLKHGFSVSCFPGTALRATSHHKMKFPEQTILVLGRETDSIDLQLINTATGEDHSLVTQHDAEKMVQVFGKLHSTMLNKPHKLDDTVALDIEFMVVDNAHSKDAREIVVLQARPYSVNAIHDDRLEAKIKQVAHYYIAPGSGKPAATFSFNPRNRGN